MTYIVHYVFGRRVEQDLAEYPSGPIAPFVFTVEVDSKPSSWESAFALLGFYRDDLITACHAAKTWIQLDKKDDWENWMPAVYLNHPTIEVSNGKVFEELLLNGERPNPWLSRATDQ